jgi:hypothetical protein
VQKPAELLPIVRAEIEARFSAADAREVASELERIPRRDAGVRGSEAWREYGRARVQLAILKYAGGDMARLRIALAAARADFRDLLVMAGLENADWPSVLSRAGFRVPPPPLEAPPVPDPSRRRWRWRDWWRLLRVVLFAALLVSLLVRFASQ